jgi:hypothetical protein
MESKEINKYKDKSVPKLLSIAERHFNLFIRNRDRKDDYFFCPTHANGRGKLIRIEGDNYQACHLFPAGKYGWIRLNEDNVHGGCKSCNYFQHGVGYVYGDWVRKTIGEERYKKLIDMNEYYKQHSWHWDRFSLIEIILKYKNINKKNNKL